MIPIERLVDVDAVIITHMHTDHFDAEAKQRLPKDVPVFVENAQDRDELLKAGFSNVQILNRHSALQSIRIIRTGGRHAYDDQTAQALGTVCGVVLQHDASPTIYVAGDTVWCRDVAEAIAAYRPPIIVVNAGANSVMDKQLIMGKDEVLRVHEAAPDAEIIATHMEAINHWTLSRAELRAFAEQHGFSDKLYIPLDGETLEFQ